ncbi:MAG TPA: hypothetical protein VGO61_21375, partial [Steroidobacteraceae bacterium]|jgi:hypothetical protein|nr:hypothetical protein [Steroidobacteraceae bacterium]
VEGVTHVSSQAVYNSPGAPPVTFHRLTDRPKKFGRTTIATVPSAGMVADRKRASKFTLTETGRLLDLSAYLDGLGGVSGSQQVRIVVYRDSSGVPGPKVAESTSRSLASGTTGTWRSFAVDGLPLLTAGDYWLAIHTGGTTQVLRNFGDGSAVNWYGNDNIFSDGASDPFGTGTSGATTLSIHGRYVVGE